MSKKMLPSRRGGFLGACLSCTGTKIDVFAQELHVLAQDNIYSCTRRLCSSCTRQTAFLEQEEDVLLEQREKLSLYKNRMFFSYGLHKTNIVFSSCKRKMCFPYKKKTVLLDRREEERFLVQEKGNCLLVQALPASNLGWLSSTTQFVARSGRMWLVVTITRPCGLMGKALAPQRLSL